MAAFAFSFPATHFKMHSSQKPNRLLRLEDKKNISTGGNLEVQQSTENNNGDAKRSTA
jgi:hypothetical protein